MNVWITSLPSFKTHAYREQASLVHSKRRLLFRARVPIVCAYISLFTETMSPKCMFTYMFVVNSLNKSGIIVHLRTSYLLKKMNKYVERCLCVWFNQVEYIRWSMYVCFIKPCRVHTLIDVCVFDLTMLSTYVDRCMCVWFNHVEYIRKSMYVCFI